MGDCEDSLVSIPYERGQGLQLPAQKMEFEAGPDEGNSRTRGGVAQRPLKPSDPSTHPDRELSKTLLCNTPFSTGPRTSTTIPAFFRTP